MASCDDPAVGLHAATMTAAAAERSGTAVVRITHNGEVWAGTTIRWHGADLAVSSDAPRRHRKGGGKLLVVDGILYGTDERDGGWVVLGTAASIDPAAAGRQTSTWPPCAKTSAARPCAGSRTA